MQTQISAIAYICIALVLALFLTRTAAIQPWYRSGMIIWFASAVVIFSLPGSTGLSLLLLAGMLLILTPRPVEQKLPYCLLIFCAVPSFVTAPLPFPFINYLIETNFQVLIGMLAIAPALIGGRRPDGFKTQPIGWGAFFMFAYFAITTLLMFRVLPFTSMARFGGEAVLGILLIYLLVLRFAISEPVLEQAMTALYVVAVVLACIALLSQFKRWNFYSAATVLSGSGVFEVRYGILRTSTTVIPVLFGFLETVGVVLLLRYKDTTGRLPQYGWLVGLLLVMGCVASMTRGAWLAGIVTVVSYFLLKSRLSSSVILVILAFCSASVAFSMFSADGFSSDLDPFRTFDYRKQLFIASWDQFLSAPFLGNPFYLDSGRFDDLVTGAGIVDVVSVYLGVVLQFGLAGLLLYITPYLIALGGILKLRSRLTEPDLKSRTLIASLGAIIVGYSVMMLTVSGVSLVYHYGVIFVAMANAAVVGTNLRLAAQREKQSLSSQINLP